MTKKTNNVNKPADAPRYTKVALKASERFRNKADLLEAVLTDDREYTIEEAEKEIYNFLTKEVK